MDTSVLENPLTGLLDEHILNLGVNQNRLYLYRPREIGVYNFSSWVCRDSHVSGFLSLMCSCGGMV